MHLQVVKSLTNNTIQHFCMTDFNRLLARQKFNQGVRFLLLSALITLDEPDKFRKYDKMYADDNLSASLLYSRALFAFKTEGDSANARKLLQKAFEKNPNVVPKMLDMLDDNYKFENVEHYSLGSPEEAIIYLNYAIFAWQRIEGAIEWSVDTIGKILKKK